MAKEMDEKMTTHPKQYSDLLYCCFITNERIYSDEISFIYPTYEKDIDINLTLLKSYQLLLKCIIILQALRQYL